MSIGVYVAFLKLIRGVLNVARCLCCVPFVLLSRLCPPLLPPRLIKTCKNCDWHDRPGNGTHECSCPKMVYGYQEKPDHDGVAVEDDESWGRQPGPDFGCIHFKHKEITHV